MHPRQLQVEARCTLTHELIHLENAHTCRCDSVVERAVRRETARRLIPLLALVDAHRWATSLNEMADELAVTPDVLCDRLGHLARDEAAEIARAALSRDA